MNVLKHAKKKSEISTFNLLDVQELVTGDFMLTHSVDYSRRNSKLH